MAYSAMRGCADWHLSQKTVTIAAPLDVIWRALTEAEELTRWYPSV